MTVRTCRTCPRVLSVIGAYRKYCPICRQQRWKDSWARRNAVRNALRARPRPVDWSPEQIEYKFQQAKAEIQARRRAA
jgi:hypothetical protein